MYVEHGWVPESESLAIGRHPLVPCDGSTPFDHFFGVSIQPALRPRSREFSEGRLEVANLRSDEYEHKDEERSRKKGERKEPKHLAWDRRDSR